MITILSRLAMIRLLAGWLALAAGSAHACTTVLVGKAATVDGSVLMATSCDGGIMGRVYVSPAAEYPPGNTVPMYYDFPAPSTWQEHLDRAARGSAPVGRLPIERTCRCILVAGHLEDSVTGGINEHGLSMGIEFMEMKPELANKKGRVSTCSNHWTTSLIANGLMRAATAREAIRLMGAMAEEYGFTYYWAPAAGCAIPVVDRQEAWIMEIFGPGEDWKPGSGKAGAVWCAQRVPDGEATCNANRSRIGRVDLGNSNEFLASANIYALAEELKLWRPGEPFVWNEVYGTVGGRGNSLREWAALNSLAPSLGLQATGDPRKDRYPFSVKPDGKVNVQALTAVMRDCYEGTPFDVTAHPAFRPGGKPSPLARPFGARDLFDLVGVRPERCISTETSGYVYVSQVRAGLPAPVAGCMWLTLGPAATGCFAPVYCGTSEIAESWRQPPDFTRIARTGVQWKFQLVEDLVGLKYQEAIEDVRKVFGPAEERFFRLQPELEDAAVQVWKDQGAAGAERFVTAYSNSCMEKVDEAYGELVDFLMFKYLYSYSSAAPPSLPRIGAVAVPPPGSGNRN